MMPETPYDWITAIAAAPFVGSFLSVLITRLPQHEEVVFRSSHCPHCNHDLAARDLVPVASYIMNSGTCRFCGASVSRLYPSIEIAAVVVAAWSATVASGWLLWATCGLGWVLLALSVMDAREMVLSDRLTMPLIGAGLFVATLLEPASFWHHIAGAVVGLVVIAGAAQIYFRLRGVDGLGLGDAKLLAAAGAWLSWDALGGVLLIGAISTLAVAIAGIFFGRGLESRTALAFGPGLALGFWLSWLYGPLVLT
jgi:leader peptidase (prepilin peptidase) / N-methyltransferase